MRIAISTIDSRELLGQYENPKPHFGTAPTALLQGFALLPHTEVHVLSCAKKVMPSPAKLADNIFFHSLHVPRLGWLRTLYQGCIRATRARLREIQPAIVHGQGTDRDGAMNSTFSGFPNVLTIHGNMRSLARINRSRPFSFNWLSAKLEGLVLPRTAGVVCLSSYTENQVKDLARRTWRVPNAVDADFFSVEPQPEPVPVVLCIGTIIHYKNQVRLIHALEPLAAKRPLKLVFLGAHDPADPYAREFLALVQQRPWCHYGGLVWRKELRQHLSRASLVMLPSLEDNCPMVVLEAQAAGIPVAGTRVGGIPDLIEDGVNGLLMNPNDLESLRTAADKILHDPALASHLAWQGRLLARERNHPKVIAQKHLDIYAEVLAHPLCSPRA